MPAPVLVLTAALTGLAAVVLTPWARRVARSDSRWLDAGLHPLLAAFGAAGAAALARTWAELVAFTALALVAALLVVVDLAVHRLPDVIVGPTYPLLLGTLALAAATSGEWSRLGRAAAAGGLLLTVYFVMAFIAPSGLGLGDVKLSGLLGSFLGWLGWPHVLLGSLAAFVLGGVMALVLVVARRARRDADFAFGPWMIAGAAVGAALGPAFAVPGWA
jgi:leader peptidase (prepilin peptidase)/N-methyltransferase